MYCADEGEKSQQEEIERVRIPCRDAKRRVWQAIDLLKQESKTHDGPLRATPMRQQSSPSSEDPCPAASSGGI